MPRQIAESTPRPKRWVCYARRRALPVYGSDNPRRATLHTGFANGKARREGGAGAPRRTGRMRREGEVCSSVTCEVHFGARRRARARRRCVPRHFGVANARASARRQGEGRHAESRARMALQHQAKSKRIVTAARRMAASRLRAPKVAHSERSRECSSLTRSGAAGEGAEAQSASGGVLGACRRRRRRGGLQLYQLRAAWGATGQLSGIWLGLWVSASGGAAQSASIFIFA